MIVALYCVVVTCVGFFYLTQMFDDWTMDMGLWEWSEEKMAISESEAQPHEMPIAPTVSISFLPAADDRPIEALISPFLGSTWQEEEAYALYKYDCNRGKAFYDYLSDTTLNPSESVVCDITRRRKPRPSADLRRQSGYMWEFQTQLPVPDMNYSACTICNAHTPHMTGGICYPCQDDILWDEQGAVLSFMTLSKG